MDNPYILETSQDFEDANFPPPGWRTNGTTESWTAESSNECPEMSGTAASVGKFERNGSSSLEVSVDFPSDGQLYFWYSVSSAMGDSLQVLVDGTEVGSWSGNSGRKKVSYPITPGVHVLRWTYVKNDDTAVGYNDTACIDNVSLTGGVFLE